METRSRRSLTCRVNATVRRVYTAPILCTSSRTLTRTRLLRFRIITSVEAGRPRQRQLVVRGVYQMEVERRVRVREHGQPVH